MSADGDSEANVGDALLAAGRYREDTERCDPMDRLAAVYFLVRFLETTLLVGRTEDDAQRIRDAARKRADSLEAWTAEADVLHDPKN